jgi:signal transduction histidine kinase
MNCSKKPILLALLLVSVFFLQAENNLLDSLRNIVSARQSTIEQIDLLTTFAENYEHSDLETAKQLALQALHLARDTKYEEGELYALQNLANIYLKFPDFKRAKHYAGNALAKAQKINDKSFLSTSLNIMGYYYQEKHEYQKAIDYFKQSEVLNVEIKNVGKLAGNYTNMGVCYSNLGQSDIALDYYLKSARIYEEIENWQSLAVAFNNIAILFSDLNKNPEAIDYYKKAIELNIKTKAYFDLASNYNNIAVVFKNIDDLENAEKYYFKAIEINEKIGNLSSIAQNYLNLAILVEKTGQNNKALNYYEKSLEICHQIDLDIGLVYNYLNRSELFIKLERWNEAEKDLKQSEEILAVRFKSDLYIHMLEQFYSLYKAKGDYKNALRYYEQYEELNDSLNSEQSKLAIEELKTKYETEQTKRKNQKLQEQNLRKEKQLKNQRIFWILTLTALLIFATLSFFLVRLRQKQKQSLEQLKRMNEELQEKSKELQALNLQKDKFFSIIAHDLKNPFHLLLGYSNLLNQELEDNKYGELDYYAKLISRSAKTGNDLLDNLMEWSRTQNNKLKIIPVELLLNDIANKAIMTFQHIAEDKKVHIENKINTKHRVLADEQSLKSILRNLISNAIKFTHTKGHIKLYSEEEGDFYRIFVEDNGIGMSQSVLAKLFDFREEFTSAGTNNEKGSGLGLTLCKEFVEKNGGSIKAESTPQKGSTFSFTLKRIK